MYHLKFIQTSQYSNIVLLTTVYFIIEGEGVRGGGLAVILFAQHKYLKRIKDAHSVRSISARRHHSSHLTFTVSECLMIDRGFFFSFLVENFHIYLVRICERISFKTARKPFEFLSFVYFKKNKLFRFQPLHYRYFNNNIIY